MLNYHGKMIFTFLHPWPWRGAFWSCSNSDWWFVGASKMASTCRMPPSLWRITKLKSLQHRVKTSHVEVKSTLYGHVTSRCGEDELIQKLNHWKDGLANKGKTKNMTGKRKTSVVVTGARWWCAVCGNGIASNSVQCMKCLKLVWRAGTVFGCNRCGTVCPSVRPWVRLPNGNYLSMKYKLTLKEVQSGSYDPLFQISDVKTAAMTTNIAQHMCECVKIVTIATHSPYYNITIILAFRHHCFQILCHKLIQHDYWSTQNYAFRSIFICCVFIKEVFPSY